jgi:hypothetical protein
MGPKTKKQTVTLARTRARSNADADADADADRAGAQPHVRVRVRLYSVRPSGMAGHCPVTVAGRMPGDPSSAASLPRGELYDSPMRLS